MTGPLQPAALPDALTLHDPTLAPIADAVRSGRRLTRDEGLALFATRDLLGLGRLANHVRERRHGNATWFNINRHVNYSNLCVFRCRFCSFARRKGEEGAWSYSLDEIFAKVRDELPAEATELHIVGGLHPELPFEFYLDMLRGIRERRPEVHLKAFTAIEIIYFSKLARLSVRETLERLIDAGLGSLPGGGAEIFDAEVRRRICREKLNYDRWIDVHRAAHQLGLRSTCTMLFGHIETHAHRVDHLLELRALQDETGGFTAFIPLAFHPENSHMPEVLAPSGAEILKTVAAARLMLDNVDNIKAYWVSLGLKTAQVAQSFGANDMDGTVMEETIYHMAGARTPQILGVRDLKHLIEEAGRTPVQRDSLYRRVSGSSGP